MFPHKMAMRLFDFQPLVSLQLCAIISASAGKWLATKLFLDHEYLLRPIKDKWKMVTREEKKPINEAFLSSEKWEMAS